MVHDNQKINELLKTSNYRLRNKFTTYRIMKEYFLNEQTFYLKTIFAYLQIIALSTGYL